MKVEKVDHIHIKITDLKKARLLFERMEVKFPVERDFSADHGLRLAFNPFPLGVELMEVTDGRKAMGQLYAEAPEGVFALSFKVNDLERAIIEMDAMGHNVLFRHVSGKVKSALFDSRKDIGLFIEFVEYPGDDFIAAATSA